jgi:hypothetical protein
MGRCDDGSRRKGGGEMIVYPADRTNRVDVNRAGGVCREFLLGSDHAARRQSARDAF